MSYISNVFLNIIFTQFHKFSDILTYTNSILSFSKTQTHYFKNFSITFDSNLLSLPFPNPNTGHSFDRTDLQWRGGLHGLSLLISTLPLPTAAFFPVRGALK